MSDEEAIEMLKSLIANIEAGHIAITEVAQECGGTLTALTLTMTGEPKIGRVNA